MGLIEKRTELIQLLLGLILVAFLIGMFITGIVKDETRILWVTTGIAAILLLLMSEQRGATVFVATMLIGTLVAREEFILEASAIVRGESLTEVRESRADTSGSLQLTQDEESQLEDRITQIIMEATGDDVDPELIQQIETARQELTVEADARKLSDSAKAWIRMLALEGPVKDSNDPVFDRYFADLSYDGWSALLAAGYVNDLLREDDATEDWVYFLTPKGERLARVLGFEPKPQAH